MANYNFGIDLPFSASGDLSTALYKFVKPATTAERVLLANGGSNPAPLGVLQNNPRSGEEAAVRVFGVTQVYGSSACGNIGYGDWLTSGSDGQAVLAGAAGAGSAIHAMALDSVSSASGILIKAYIFPNPMSGSGVFSDNTP